MKIRTRIGLYFIVIFSIIILVTSFVIGFYFYNLSKTQIFSYLFSGSKDKAEHIISVVNSKKETSEILAAASVYRDFLKEPENSNQYLVIKEKIDKRLFRTMEIDSNLLEVFILNKFGKVVGSSDKAQEGKDKSNDLYFTQSLKETYIKDIYFSESTKKINYTISSPILDDNKDFLGISVLRFSPEVFYNIVSNENEIGKTEENFLINKDKYFITPSLFLGKDVILKQKVETVNTNFCFSKKETEYIKQNQYNGLKEFLGNTALIEASDYRGVDVIATHIFIPETNWCLITKIDRSELMKSSNKILIILLLSFLASLLLFLLISFFTIRIITKPILALLKSVKKVESGDFNIKIENKAKDEVGDLARNFEKMVLSVKSSKESVDKQVEDQTKEIKEKQKYLQDQQKAVFNILEDVEEEKSKTQALLSGIGEGVIATDEKANITFMNNAAEELIGYKTKESIGKNIYKFLPIVDEKGKTIGEDNRPFHLALELNQKVFVHPEDNYYYVKKNGEKFPVIVSVTPIMFSNKLIGAINVFRDITHEKQIDKAKTEFVSLASHQLRTPLSAINWYAEMLLAGDAGKISKTQKQYLDQIYASNKRMVELVNSLLNVSRIDLGTFTILPELIDISKIADSILLELTPMIKNKKMVIEKNYSNDLPKIKVDQKLTRIIFQNLLSNSIKYTPEGGKVSVSIEKNQKNVLIKVKDTGYGILEKDKNKIFEKLFRADNVREKETDGTGLGLYIVKSILEQSGGKIYFESKENIGTTFFAEIPLTGMKRKEGSKDLS